MFDVGFQELVLLFCLGLMVLGPERLPRVAAQLGRWIGKARRMARTVSAQLRDELDVDLDSIIDPQERPSTHRYRRPGVDDLRPVSTQQDEAEPTDDGAAGQDQSTHGR